MKTDKRKMVGAFNPIGGDESSAKVKKEAEDLEEEISFKCSSSPSNILKSLSEIKEEIRDLDCVDIKEEPLNVDQEHGTEASNFNLVETKEEKGQVHIYIREEPFALEEEQDIASTKIKEEVQDDIRPCHQRLKRRKADPKAHDVLLSRGKEKSSKAIKYGAKSCHLPKEWLLSSNDVHGRLTREFLPPRDTVRGAVSTFPPDSAQRKRKENTNSLPMKKSSSPTAPIKSLKAPKKRPYLCPICHKEFPCKRDLKNHRIRTCKKHFGCDVCKQSFDYRSQLALHMSVHTGEKPYKCSVCSKVFSLPFLLERHKQIHTGQKPYKCSVCSKRFNFKDNLRSHKRIHTGEKPYKCSVCSKGFNQSSNLKRHERTHSGEKPYKCSVCSKGFSDMSYLKLHERFHTGEKPYKCSVCSKRFSDRNYVRSHEKIHTGEKPYKCSVCSKGFIQSSNLKKHQRTHIG